MYGKNEKWGVHFEKGGVRFAFFVGVSDSSYDCHNISAQKYGKLSKEQKYGNCMQQLICLSNWSNSS